MSLSNPYCSNSPDSWMMPKNYDQINKLGSTKILFMIKLQSDNLQVSLDGVERIKNRCIYRDDGLYIG